MTAKKCDVCFSYYDNLFYMPNITVHKYFHGYGEDKIYDICPKCQKFLENWLHEDNKKEGT